MFPRQIVNSWLTRAFLLNGSTRGWNWVGTTFSDDRNLLKRSDFNVVNLGIDHKVDAHHTVSLRAFNVFDEVYATSGGAPSGHSLHRAPPRSLSHRLLSGPRMLKRAPPKPALDSQCP